MSASRWGSASRRKRRGSMPSPNASAWSSKKPASISKPPPTSSSACGSRYIPLNLQVRQIIPPPLAGGSKGGARRHCERSEAIPIPKRHRPQEANPRCNRRCNTDRGGRRVVGGEGDGDGGGKVRAVSARLFGGCGEGSR